MQKMHVERTTITVVTPTPHNIVVGDTIEISGKSQWRKLYELFTRPRIKVIEEATNTTFCILERRMTWKEWRSAILSAISE